MSTDARWIERPERSEPRPRWQQLTMLSGSIIAVSFAIVSALVTLHGTFERKFHNLTGQAEWIWLDHRLSSERPVVFFATRDFTVPPTHRYMKIKVFGDPIYSLFVNGVEVGGGRSSREGALDVYDVTELIRKGSNRIVAGVRSGNGVGGFLLAVDFSPLDENAVVTDRSWRLITSWSEEILKKNPEKVPAFRPLLLGRPPDGRWNFPRERERPLKSREQRVVEARSARRFRTSIRKIVTIQGVAVAILQPIDATAFDFGPGSVGRVVLELGRPGPVKLRYANDESEFSDDVPIDILITAKGESKIEEPVAHTFRYVVVYRTEVDAKLLVD